MLDVALETFARSGLEATTMDDIAREAGVTKPLLYQHFKSKRALFLELLDDVVVRIIDALTAAAELAPGPRLQVEAVCDAYFRFVLHNESAMRLLFDSTLPYDVELAEAMRRVDDTIASAIATAHPRRHRSRSSAGPGRCGRGHGQGCDPRLAPFALEPQLAGFAEMLDAEAGLVARRVAEFAWAGLRLVHRD